MPQEGGDGRRRGSGRCEGMVPNVQRGWYGRLRSSGSGSSSGRTPPGIGHPSPVKIIPVLALLFSHTAAAAALS